MLQLIITLYYLETLRLNNKIIIMQQLYQVIKQRFQSLQLVSENKVNTEQYRQLRQQQKLRCEKQAWILSMFRAKKTNFNSNIKNNYFKYSYEIMRVIDPTFLFEMEPALTDQSFLNDFVCLYTKFFDNYEDKFQFKVKIRNLLRPTNHNILNDMVKYLSDFSRDYSQHIYLWQMKESKRIEQKQLFSQSQRRLSINHGNVQSAIYSANSNTPIKEKPLQFRNSVNFGQNSFKKANEDNQTQVLLRKAQFNKMYGILEIQPVANFVFLDKIKTNADILRLRMNELYRDLKYRNNTIKSSINLYQNAYAAKFNPEQINSNNFANKQSVLEDAHPHISHPFRVSLIIERNGFSCINVTTHDQRYLSKDDKMSPLKQKHRLSSLSNKQTSASVHAKYGSKTQFVLNSLKVLRVSQNFLPPLHNMKQSTRIDSQQEVRKQVQLKDNKLTYSNTENLLNLQPQPGKQIDQHIGSGVIYYNQELIRQAERRKVQKRRITEMRKHFTSQDRNKNKSIKRNDPEQKIVQWLDKINLMKQMERKKILGLT